MARRMIMLHNELHTALTGLTLERFEQYDEHTLTVPALPRWLDDALYGTSQLDWGGVKGLAAHTTLTCLRRLPVITVQGVQELLECSASTASNYTRACRLVLDHTRQNPEAQEFIQRYSAWVQGVPVADGTAGRA